VRRTTHRGSCSGGDDVALFGLDLSATSSLSLFSGIVAMRVNPCLLFSALFDALTVYDGGARAGFSVGQLTTLYIGA
jgi:hypothetical protein